MNDTSWRGGVDARSISSLLDESMELLSDKEATHEARVRVSRALRQILDDRYSSDGDLSTVRIVIGVYCDALVENEIVVPRPVALGEYDVARIEASVLMMLENPDMMHVGSDIIYGDMGHYSMLVRLVQYGDMLVELSVRDPHFMVVRPGVAGLVKEKLGVVRTSLTRVLDVLESEALA